MRNRRTTNTPNLAVAGGAVAGVGLIAVLGILLQMAMLGGAVYVVCLVLQSFGVI